jgi:2-keto-4-pentenoate hydratase/2-oxohepta-3-ene-1,7-dioic acid hydratase in catechol pathway
VRPDNDTSSPGSGSEAYCQTAPDSLHRVELQRPRCRDRSACPRRTHSFPQVAQLVGPNDDVCIPGGSTKLDWEVELGVVISRRTSSLDSVENAYAAIPGYMVVNDVSERAFQIERGGQWSKGKSAETFNPAGPWLVMPDEIDDVRDLRMWH